ncbi:MAG: PKD domain-containing protein [Candidatus Woesearchaeota archaeon]|nr:PKD domain-containing protein [Candidatus Woesearchaeota archaeon]
MAVSLIFSNFTFAAGCGCAENDDCVVSTDCSLSHGGTYNFHSLTVEGTATIRVLANTVGYDASIGGGGTGGAGGDKAGCVVWCSWHPSRPKDGVSGRNGGGFGSQGQSGGFAGGTITLNIATELNVVGEIDASGFDGTQGIAGENCDACTKSGGGGSGGEITINAIDITGTGKISAKGGVGGPGSRGGSVGNAGCGGGGGGAGGRINLFYNTLSKEIVFDTIGGEGGAPGPGKRTPLCGGAEHGDEGSDGVNGPNPAQDTYAAMCEAVEGDFNEAVLTKFANPIAHDGSDGCCGDDPNQDGGRDNGYLFLDTDEGNIEYICTFFNDEWKWKRATDYVDLSKELISTRVYRASAPQLVFFDLLANSNYRFPSKDGRINADAWLACGPAGGTSHLRASIEENLGAEAVDSHIFYAKAPDWQPPLVNTNFRTNEIDPPDDDEDYDSGSMDKKNIPLTDVRYSIAGEEFSTGTGDGDDGPAGSSIPAPQWMCIKKGNVGFWAGCGANTEDLAHDFYPGSRATTFKDYGTIENCATDGELKPGSRCLYNNIGAIGLYRVPRGTNSFTWYDVQLRERPSEEEPVDEEYLELLKTDWSGNRNNPEIKEYLEFSFFSAKMPEVYTITIEYNDPTDPNSPDVNSAISEISLTEFIEGDIRPGIWHRVKIDLDEELPTDQREKVVRISIELKSEDVPASIAKDISTDLWPREFYYDLIFLDAFSITTGNTNRYCTLKDDGADLIYEWDGDPDLFHNDLQACNEQPGYMWTGNRCCGFHPSLLMGGGASSQHTLAGCWDRRGVPNNVRVGDSLRDDAWNNVMYYYSQWNICGPEVRPTFPADQQPTYYSVSRCQVPGPDSSFYCNYGETEFTNEVDLDGTTIPYDPSIGIQSSSRPGGTGTPGCCHNDNCWNGAKCVASGVRLLNDPSLDYECTDGTWDELRSKYHFSTSETGICRTDQCFAGATATPSCVEAGTYVNEDGETDKGDNYCELLADGNAVWSSRTKLIVEKLVEFSNPSDYTLFCDDKEASLNKPSGPFENPFCVLKSRTDIVIGTSVDDLGQLDLFLSKASLNSGECRSLTPSSDFQKCGSLDAYYNNEKNLIIFKSSAGRGIWTTITNAVSSLIAWFEQKPSTQLPPQIAAHQKLNKVYLAAKNERTIIGVIEPTPSKDYLAVEYLGFAMDVCEQIANYPNLASLQCVPHATDPHHYLVTAIADSNSLNGIWPDLTSKIRINPDALPPPTAEITTPSDNLQVIVDESITFNGGGNSPVGGIITYKWDLGDDRTTVGSSIINYRYPTAGIYTVTLTVTDSRGAVGIDTITVIVTET